MGHAETWVLRNGDRLTGELIEETVETIVVKHDQLGRLAIPRSSLSVPPKSALAPATMAAVKLTSSWTRQLEAGYNLQQNTSPAQSLSLRAELNGKSGANNYRATARYARAESLGVVVSDRREADFRWRHDLTPKLFSQLQTAYLSDGARVDVSLEQQAGGGIKVLNDTRKSATVGLGAVAQYLDRGELADYKGLLGVVSQDYSYKWSDQLKISQEAQLMMSAQDVSLGSLGGRSDIDFALPRGGSYRVRFNSALQGRLTKVLSFNLRYEYDYDHSVPDPDSRAEQRLTTSMGYLW